ncbi:exodeoxyribonuclease III [Blattabacterium cuenoti]|uniref:exodeoxyribonuclease III n=1 Tax=Blattabacterium cuenoti TaxID=1653831 RepID=UPI00163CAE21|nr:exodeoxyribonuclease III [Blattabacterium cuenoti]
MKIVTYNINGIRSGINKGLSDWINVFNPDIVCFQEIKACKEQINTNLFKKFGYFNYWFSSSKKKGYSGVGILSKQEPYNVNYGLGINAIDIEGRVIRIDLKDKISIINIYIPSGTYLKQRLNFKLYFMSNFLLYIKKVKQQLGLENIIICGDYNICHKEIDIYDPEHHHNISGFLPQERKWINKLLDFGFLDSFRIFVKTGNHYSWWNYRFNARQKNHGWRIDYIMISYSLIKRINNAYFLPYVKFSDHCPMVLELDYNK